MKEQEKEQQVRINLKNKFGIDKNEKFGGIKADEKAVDIISKPYIENIKTLINTSPENKKAFADAIIKLKAMNGDGMTKQVEANFFEKGWKEIQKLPEAEQKKLAKIFERVASGEKSGRAK